VSLLVLALVGVGMPIHTGYNSMGMGRMPVPQTMRKMVTITSTVMHGCTAAGVA